MGSWARPERGSHPFVFAPTLQRKHQEIRAMRSQLKKIEDLGAAMEEALILDNKYTEHSTVGLAQQWDQLDQLGMRMQHNLEQQIQARYCACRWWTHGGHGRASPAHATCCVGGWSLILLFFQEHNRCNGGGPQGVQHDV